MNVNTLWSFYTMLELLTFDLLREKKEEAQAWIRSEIKLNMKEKKKN